jgi:hypothetical protein
VTLECEQVRDDVDLRVVQKLLPARGPALEAELACGALEGLGSPAGERDQTDALRKRVDVVQRVERVRVSATDPAVADDPDAHRVTPHRRDPLKPFLALSIDLGKRETRA